MIKEFKIAGMLHHVVELDNIKDGSRYGEYNEVERIIYLANRINIDDEWYDIPEDYKEMTFYHELGHVFQAFTAQDYDEKDAQIFANFMTEFVNSKIEEN